MVENKNFEKINIENLPDIQKGLLDVHGEISNLISKFVIQS
jgi:hypothetical protein